MIPRLRCFTLKARSCALLATYAGLQLSSHCSGVPGSLLYLSLFSCCLARLRVLKTSNGGSFYFLMLMLWSPFPPIGSFLSYFYLFWTGNTFICPKIQKLQEGKVSLLPLAPSLLSSSRRQRQSYQFRVNTSRDAHISMVPLSYQDGACSPHGAAPLFHLLICTVSLWPFHFST